MPASNSSAGTNPNILNKRKIAVLGSRSVGLYLLVSLPPCRNALTSFTRTGKSSLVIQYAENHFVENYHPTIENTFAKTIKTRGEEYDCDIIDTAGQVSIRHIQLLYSVPITLYSASRDSV